MRQTTGEGIGQSVPRLEDDRYLRGKGEFIADIRVAGIRDLAFVRSPVAHARILNVRKPPRNVSRHRRRSCRRHPGCRLPGCYGA
jgi:hypothetical protein